MTAVVIVGLLAIGAFFMVAGTLGLLRFPDLPTRLHAVAKVDNLGLGFIAAGLVVHAVGYDDGGGWGVVGKLVLIWLLALLGTAANSHLLAVPPREEDRHGDDEDDKDTGKDPGQDRGGAA